MLTILVLVLVVIGVTAAYDLRCARRSLDHQLRIAKQLRDVMLSFPPSERRRARVAVVAAEATLRDAQEKNSEVKDYQALSVDEKIELFRMTSKATDEYNEAVRYVDFLLENNTAVFFGRKTADAVRQEAQSFLSTDRVVKRHMREHVFGLVLRLQPLQSIAVKDLFPGHILLFTCSTCSSEQQVKVGDLHDRRRESMTCVTCHNPNEVESFRLYSGQNPFTEDVLVLDQPPNHALEPAASAGT